MGIGVPDASTSIGFACLGLGSPFPPAWLLDFAGDLLKAHYQTSHAHEKA